ncbi:MAG: protein kinase, partial [Planctomycetota bacterium]|nr:protein kinase [Planctomycetota bacterium]
MAAQPHNPDRRDPQGQERVDSRPASAAGAAGDAGGVSPQTRRVLACRKCNGRFSIPVTMKPADARCPACSSRLVGIDLAKTVLTSPSDSATGAAPAPSPVRTPGASGRFGRYEIVEKVGEGGMGTVYKARDPQLGRFVALKVLRAQRVADGPGLVARFQREARAAAKLRHPNIVQIHDVGMMEDEYYLTMDYIDGESLQALLGDTRAKSRPTGIAVAAQRAAATKSDGKPGQAQRRLTLNQGLSIIRDMAFALDSAHKQGIAHRDIKPANILIDKAGTPFLVDFGLAKDFKEVAKSGVTVEGQFMGTPMYFSPEQAAGDTARIGPAADVYSLGVIMYQLLTGIMPYEADSFLALAWQIMNAEPAAPSRLSAAVPKDLEAICLKAIEKAPRHRYQDARAFGDDIGRYLAGETVLARTPGLFERILRRAMRKKIQSAVVAAAVLAGIALGVFFWASSAGREAALRAKLDEARTLEDGGELSRARDLYLIVLQGAQENPDALAGRARVDAALSAQVAEQASERARAEARGEVEKLLREAEKTWGDATNVLQNMELPIEKYHNGIE